MSAKRMPCCAKNKDLLDRQWALFARSQTSEPDGDRLKSGAGLRGRGIRGPAESVRGRSPGRCANRDAPRVDKWDLERRKKGNPSLSSMATPDKTRNFFFLFALKIRNTKATGLCSLTFSVCLLEMAMTFVSTCQVTVSAQARLV